MFQGAKLLLSKIVSDRVKASKRFELGGEVSSTDAGAISVETVWTAIVTAGAETRTLANGYEGQLKIIFCKTYVGDAVLTPANFANGTTITFNAVNDCWIGIFHAGEWHTVALGVTAAIA